MAVANQGYPAGGSAYSDSLKQPTSILVNPSALTALQSLRTTQNALNTTQKEISTGLKISSAADNASTWSIAESMKSDKSVLGTISDSQKGDEFVLPTWVLGADGKITEREVKVGVMNRVSAQILSGLEPGEKVVLKLVSPEVVHKTEAGAVVFVDVAHVWSTGWRVYADGALLRLREERSVTTAALSICVSAMGPIVAPWYR